MKRICPICRAGAEPDAFELGGYRIYACSRCGLRFAPDAFDARVDYEAMYETDEYQAEQLRPLESSADQSGWADYVTYAPFFIQVIQRPGARLLDVGCGVGRFCHAASSRGWDVTGIDVSERAIEAGSRLAPFPMRKCTIEEIAQEGELYDVVTAFEVLEHLADPVKFLSLIAKVLRPGGQVFCTVPNWDCSLIQNASRPDWMPPVHVCFFTRSALKHAVDAAGFRGIAVHTISGDPPPKGALAKAKWLRRRLLRRPVQRVGLSLHAWLPE
ncbi:MAG TPA: methyltransferase domain-containing protein [Armatimonadota bacterium]|nr:methyltransferase domain-containing protein [Armatimonadota bacterium]